MNTRRPTGVLLALAIGVSLLAGCSAAGAGASTQGGTLNIDFATYNPLSLIIKQQGWLETELGKQGITVKLAPVSGIQQGQ